MVWEFWWWLEGICSLNFQKWWGHSTKLCFWPPPHPSSNLWQKELETAEIWTCKQKMCSNHEIKGYKCLLRSQMFCFCFCLSVLKTSPHFPVISWSLPPHFGPLQKSLSPGRPVKLVPSPYFPVQSYASVSWSKRSWMITYINVITTLYTCS